MGRLASYEHTKNNTWSLKYSHEQFLDLYKQGLNDTEISKILKCSHVTVHKKREKFELPPNFRYKTKIKLNEFKDLHSQGKNDREIADYFGLNSRWIGYKRQKLGLSKNYDNHINRTPGELTFE